ncbi:hypothetical protein C0J52_21622 [Blattella germanica]|nr:hypothetical protein C0J52_21622 [Blattella germanica]
MNEFTENKKIIKVILKRKLENNLLLKDVFFLAGCCKLIYLVFDKIEKPHWNNNGCECLQNGQIQRIVNKWSKMMGIESSSEEDDDGEGQEEQSLISWIIRGSLSLAMFDTLFT